MDQWGEKGPCGVTMSLLLASVVIVRLGLVVQVPGIFDGDLVSGLGLISAIAFLEHTVKGELSDCDRRSPRTARLFPPGPQT